MYAAVRLYRSSLSDGAQREQIRRELAAIADKCIRYVIPENDYNLLRADGKVGMVCKMWGDIGPHEYLRLPMFYLAAWAVTRDGRHRERAEKYLHTAVKKTLDSQIVTDRYYTALQLQYSLRAVCEKIDLEKHCTYAPLLLFFGYWLCRENLLDV